jgi:hypothetical protein
MGTEQPLVFKANELPSSLLQSGGKKMLPEKPNETSIPEKPEAGQQLCPLIGELGHECFSSNLRSLNVEAAIYYCGKNFTQCEIYKRRPKK